MELSISEQAQIIESLSKHLKNVQANKKRCKTTESKIKNQIKESNLKKLIKKLL